MFLSITKTEKLATGSKLYRFLYNPFKYAYAIVFRNVIYRATKKKRIVSAPLFWGKPMFIALPASTDIFLTGGKSHSSEIRLAKFLLNTLKPGDHFLDIGAHYGYFTLLASEITGKEGKVLAFEPSKEAFEILTMNALTAENISVFRKAVSNKNEPVVFYEFPNLYSEYNTSNVQQFQNESWFNHFSPNKVEIEATTIDLISTENNLHPKLIKIDVEGAENLVIKGGKNFFQKESPILIMEYLSQERNNLTHKEALKTLSEWGYTSNFIDKNGHIIPLTDIDLYLQNENMDSDNIVFKKNILH